jgi:hypothetical protein
MERIMCQIERTGFFQMEKSPVPSKAVLFFLSDYRPGGLRLRVLCNIDE